MNTKIVQIKQKISGRAMRLGQAISSIHHENSSNEPKNSLKIFLFLKTFHLDS